MQTPTNNSECDLASVMNRLDTLTAIVRVMHTQLNETASELSETKRNLLEAKSHVSRLGRMVVDSHRKNETLEIRMAAMEAAFGSLIEENREIPGLRTKIDEQKIQIDVLNDKLVAVEDKVESSVGRADGEQHRIGMLLPQPYCNTNAYNKIKSKAITVKTPLTIMDSIHGYDKYTREMYIHNELCIDDTVAYTVNDVFNHIPIINWGRLIEFPCLEELTVVADAYVGFTKYASSSSCRILKITSVTKCGKDVIVSTTNKITQLLHDVLYPCLWVSGHFGWLTRFPKLEVIDFMDTRQHMLHDEDIVDFLPHCPSMRSIRGIGSKDNIKLVRYCSVNGITLEDK
jgi:hypothetical protein